MDKKRYIGAFLALFVFTFLYDWFVHGFLMMSMYEETSQVWRDYGSDMASCLSLSIPYQLILSAWTAFAFTKIYKEGGLTNGLYFGLYFGVFAGILTGAWYIWLPVPAKLGASWFVSSVIYGLGGGAVLGSTYRTKPSRFFR